MMKLKTRLWIEWVLCVLLMLLPVATVLWMSTVGEGFERSIWLATVAVAVIAFIRAQQTVRRLRVAGDSEKLEEWFARTRKASTPGRRTSPDGEAQPAGDSAHVTSSFATEERLRNYRKVGFWRRLGAKELRRDTGKLFHFLGRQVHRAAAREGLEEGLVLDFRTYVGFASGGKSTTFDDANRVERVLASNPTYRAAILISTQGFSRKARKFAEKRAIFLLDADNIAGLARTRQAVD
jgi:hypothetical protein